MAARRPEPEHWPGGARNSALILTLLDTGIRASERIGLEPTDLDRSTSAPSSGTARARSSAGSLSVGERLTRCVTTSTSTDGEQMRRCA